MTTRSYGFLLSVGGMRPQLSILDVWASSGRGLRGVITLFPLSVPHHPRPLHGCHIGFSLFSQHVLPFHGQLPPYGQRGLAVMHSPPRHPQESHQPTMLSSNIPPAAE